MSDYLAFGFQIVLMALVAAYFYWLGYGAGVAALTRTIDNELARRRRENAGLE